MRSVLTLLLFSCFALPLVTTAVAPLNAAEITHCQHGTYSVDSLCDTYDGKVTFVFENRSNHAWVDFEVHINGKKRTTSGHVGRGKTRRITVDLGNGCRCFDVKISKWSPGAFGIPGSGGGEVRLRGTTGGLTAHVACIGG